MLLLLSADFFFKFNFSKISFRTNIRVSNSLDQDQDGSSFNPDLWVQTVCKGLQQMTKVAASKEIVKIINSLYAG